MQVILTGNTKGLALVWTCGHGLEFFTSVEKRRQCATMYLEHTKSGMKHANEALYASFPHSILAWISFEIDNVLEGILNATNGSSNTDFHQPSILSWIAHHAKYSCSCLDFSIYQVCLTK